MAKLSPWISDRHKIFIEKQKLFFTATAPLQADGHINLSPKGTDSFRVLSENLVGYMDMYGSGNETSAHLLENQRITFMFCAFDGPPNILRLYATGKTIIKNSPKWKSIAPAFPIHKGTRQIIIAEVYKVQTSCGYSVPLYEHIGHRNLAEKWVDKKGPEGLKKYLKEKNALSLDGLPSALNGNVSE